MRKTVNEENNIRGHIKGINIKQKSKKFIKKTKAAGQSIKKNTIKKIKTGSEKKLMTVIELNAV